MGGISAMSSLDRVIRAHGDEIVRELIDEPDDHPGQRTLALYAKDGRWTHVAIRGEDGPWMSKLGSSQLIAHPDVRDLEGDEYGEVATFMTRPDRGADCP